MAEIGPPLLYAAFLWWFATGAILWLGQRPGLVSQAGVAALSVGALASLYGLHAAARDPSLFGAYLGFTAALGVWAWIELTFLTGLVTGPRTAPCPEGASGWRRFRLAASTLAYHEGAIVAGALIIAALTWGGSNPTGLLTFLVLATMRLSAKLNLFFGVPNVTVEFLPERLAYLTSYFGARAVNGFFPYAVGFAVAAALIVAERALGADAAAFEAAGFALVFALLALAILEHAFMVLPLREAALWRWALPAAGRSPGGKG